MGEVESARSGSANAPPRAGPGRPVLELSAVTKRFGPTLALDGVSVDFRPGEIHALVGENGAGKSTLLGVMAGFVTPDPPSEMRLGGEVVDLARHSPRAAQRLGISIVPQELAVVEPMTVAENIFLGREPRRGPFLDSGAMRQRARKLLARLGASVSPDEPVERLSVAQLQLVEIARALSLESRVLAMDEPSAVLAGEELERLFRVVHQLANEGVAVVYVSHRLDEVFAQCDRFTVLKDGKVVVGGAVRDVRRTDLIRMMVGREVADTFPARSDSTGPVRIRVSDLSLAGKLDGITFDVRAGEILGIAGLMGSGRTTLAKTIFGAIQASRGTVEIDGAVGPFGSPRQALDAGLAYLPEDRRREGLAVGKPVGINVTLLALRQLVRGPFRLISQRSERARVRDLVARLAIRTSPSGKDLAARLSGGNQQKVVIAKWLEANPRVLILDEPTRGIDVGAKDEIYRILRGLAAQGLAIVVISSELIEVLGLADRILVISEGRVAGIIPGEGATEEAVMGLATGVADEASA